MVAMNLNSLIIYSWLVISSLACVYFAFLVTMTKSWIKPVFTSKLSKTKDLILQLNKDGSGSLSPVAKGDGVTYDKKGRPLQTHKTEKGVTEALCFLINGTRVFIRPQDSLTALTKIFDVAPLNISWLKELVARDRMRVEAGKKVYKKKATEIPIIWLLFIIMGVAAAIILYVMFA